MDTFTSMLSGVIIFGILGNLAYETQTDDIANVVQGGTGLAFISYPDAIAKFAKVPQVSLSLHNSKFHSATGLHFSSFRSYSS